MEVVKKNIVSIICGVVAILAICALWWPTGSWTEELTKKLNASKDTDSKIDKLINAKHPALVPPNVSIASADAPLMQLYPTQTILDQAHEFSAGVKQQSQSMLDKVIERNLHVTAVPFTAKNPPDPFYFKHAYLKWIGLEGKDDPKTGENIFKVLQGIAPPDDTEIKAEKDKIYKNDFENRIIMVEGAPANLKDVTDQFDQFVEKLPETLRRQRAEQYKIYLESDALDYSSAFALGESGNRQATFEQVWFAQNMLWIDQDVAGAIALINKDAKSIMDAPVKQLIKISVPEDLNQYITGRGPSDVAAPALDDGALAGKAFALSETGRVCNPLYDVIHFHVELNVDASKIPMILTELQRGRLLAVYSCDASAIDARAVFADGYVYGTAPVVKLSLECEELFMRGWTVNGKDGPLMPPSVQAFLGATPAVAAQP